MEQEIIQKLASLDAKLDETSRIMRQMRMYFLVTLIISVAVIVLPMIGLFFVIPQFLSSYGNMGL